jgi:tetratricopeptide (TPR) repeat protein
MRLLSENGDKNKKYACYQGLFIIAMHLNETNEAMIMYRKMTEIKFGTEQLPTNSNDILINETDYTKILTDTQQLLYMDSQMSLDRPLDELLTYSESDEYRDAIGKLPNLHFTLATTFMKNGVYDLAIQIFESVLQAIRLLENVTFDPLLKARCHMQLAHCYYELKLNETALNNYNLALEQDIHLLLGEYIGTLIGIGKVLEITNNYKEALYKYIELAEIYQRNSSIAGLDEQHNTEECIQRVLSHLITMD